MINIYIASCTPNGGIYRYQADDNGKIKFMEKTELDRPMYMKLYNDKLYILLRESFANHNSGLIIFDLVNGKPTNPSNIISTGGQVACHLEVNANNVYCVNYISGNITKIQGKTIQHLGKGQDPIRQNVPHTHCVCETPDGKYICVADLGLDTIFVYDKNLNLWSVII